MGVLARESAALHAKAKAAPHQRFQALYDPGPPGYGADVLAHAYVCCPAPARRGGAAGVEGWTFAASEAYGRERGLALDTRRTLRVPALVLPAKPGPRVQGWAKWRKR